jgi:membrane protease YdiL (CAAX protease family)
MNTVTHLPSGSRPVSRAVLFGLLLLGGLLIFVFGSPYFDVFPTNNNPIFAAALVMAFGLPALALWRHPHYGRYAPPAYALFVAAAANLALVIGPFNRLVTATEPYSVLAQDKFVQFLTVVPVLVILSWLARRDLGWIFLKRGRPRRWLPFGLVSLAVFAVAATAIMLLSEMSAAEIWDVAPYILAFVTANAIMEELWFRGVFLRPYEAEIGWTGTMVVTALAYGVSHTNATYFESAIGIMFGLGVIGFGLILAWAMRWADSLWGAVLFHMGMDLMIILPVVASV